MTRSAGLGLLIALLLTTAAESQTLAGLHLGDPESAAIAAVGPGYRARPIKDRPGASVLTGEQLSVTVCNGVISGLRITRPGDFLTYASLLDAEASRQGLSQTTVTHESSVQDIALAVTTWRRNGVATQYELAAVGKPGANVQLISLDYKTDPDPCPKAG